MGTRELGKAKYRAYQQKRRRLYQLCSIILTLTLTLAVSASSVKAQNQFSSLHKYTYGQSATFILNIEDETAYGNFVLYIDAADMNVQSYIGRPANNQIVIERNLRDNPFPPFGMITYWWEYTDTANTLINTRQNDIPIH